MEATVIWGLVIFALCCLIPVWIGWIYEEIRDYKIQKSKERDNLFPLFKEEK